jgi:pimeloyl-ACP methyl ester carboxylesterase
MPGVERTLKVRGKAIQLWEGGDGPPLLYLHGAGTYWWLPAHDGLAARHRVVLPVHPGFGESTGVEEIDDIEDLVFHVLDVLDELRLDRVDVVGLSLGGWTAAELALRQPQRVRRMVLVNAAGLRLPDVPTPDLFLASVPEAREMLFADPKGPIAMAAMPDTPPPPEKMVLILRGREAAARLLWNPARRYRKLMGRLDRIKPPTLVVWGAQDRLFPLPYGQAWAQGVPGAKLVTLDRCGHLPPVEATDRFVQTVLDFLKGDA